MSAIAAAFEQAGYVSPRERLHAVLMQVCALPEAEWREAEGAEIDPEADRQRRRLMQIAKDSLNLAPRKWDGAKDAFYRAVRNDAPLLWELFAPYRAQAVQLLLSRAAAELRELERAQRAAAEPSAGGRSSSEDHIGCASRANFSAGQAAVDRARVTLAGEAAIVRKSLLDTFTINGRPIGDITPAEALAWAKSRRRDVRFVELLTANLPPGDPIRRYRRADDTQAIYEQAQREVGDAA